MTVILLLVSFGLACAAWLMATQATQGAVYVGLAATVGIWARIIQADQHRVKDVRELNASRKAPPARKPGPRVPT